MLLDYLLVRCWIMLDCCRCLAGALLGVAGLLLRSGSCLGVARALLGIAGCCQYVAGVLLGRCWDVARVFLCFRDVTGLLVRVV